MYVHGYGYVGIERGEAIDKKMCKLEIFPKVNEAEGHKGNLRDAMRY